MNIAIVSPSVYVFGGAEVLMLRLMEYLKHSGHDVTFITTNLIDEYREKLEKTDITTLECSFVKHKSTFVNLYREAKIINRLLVENRFDVINVHNFPANLLFAKQSAPVVWMCNEPTKVVLSAYINMGVTNYRYWVARMILLWDRIAVRRYIDSAIVSDEYNRQRYQTLYGKSAQMINYGIDYPFFSIPIEAQKDEHTFTVVQVGMITELKNQMASVKTIESLRSKIPNIKLILAGHGTGAYFDELKNYVKKHNLDEHIVILGHVNREKVRELYRSCDVMLHPVDAQGGWLSPFEAMSAHIPVIVSKELTASPIIEANNLGIVTDDYQNAVYAIYNNPRTDGERIAKWVKEHLSWDKFSAQMLESFNKAVNG